MKTNLVCIKNSKEKHKENNVAIFKLILKNKNKIFSKVN